MGKSCKKCQYRENKALTPDVIKKHFYNNQIIGMYPMLDDETCYLLAFDFDDKKDENNIKEDVLAFASTMFLFLLKKVDQEKEFIYGYFLEIKLKH